MELLIELVDGNIKTVVILRVLKKRDKGILGDVIWEITQQSNGWDSTLPLQGILDLILGWEVKS